MAHLCSHVFSPQAPSSSPLIAHSCAHRHIQCPKCGHKSSRHAPHPSTHAAMLCSAFVCPPLHISSSFCIFRPARFMPCSCSHITTPCAPPQAPMPQLSMPHTCTRVSVPYALPKHPRCPAVHPLSCSGRLSVTSPQPTDEMRNAGRPAPGSGHMRTTGSRSQRSTPGKPRWQQRWNLRLRFIFFPRPDASGGVRFLKLQLGAWGDYLRILGYGFECGSK